MAVYSEGFLDTLVSINFPARGGYVLLNVTAVNSIAGTVQLPCPTVDLTLPPKAKLVTQSESCAKKTIPAHTVTTRFYYVWNDIVPPPTPLNYNNPIPSIANAPYATQFAISIILASGSFTPPDPHGNGTFNSLAAAEAYAAVWNAFKYPGLLQQAFLPDGSHSSPVLLTPSVYVVWVDAPVVVPAQNISTLTGKYLIQVPPEFRVVTAHVVLDPAPDSNSTLTASGFSDVTLKAVAPTPTPDTTSSSSRTRSGFYNISSVITANPSGKPHKNTVVVT